MRDEEPIQIIDHPVELTFLYYDSVVFGTTYNAGVANTSTVIKFSRVRRSTGVAYL